MPIFKDYQEIPVEIEVGTKLFYQAMTPGEKQEMRKLLRTGIGSTTSHADLSISSVSVLGTGYHLPAITAQLHPVPSLPSTITGGKKLSIFSGIFANSIITFIFLLPKYMIKDLVSLTP